VRIAVRVVPRAARSGLTRDPDGGLRARLAAPPVEGAANRALIELLAARLGIPRSTVRIERGARGRAKVVAIEGLDEAGLAARLGVEGALDVDKAEKRG
jgi:uncharacterized protein YggU (UPF0235/DUF167 family)